MGREVIERRFFIRFAVLAMLAAVSLGGCAQFGPIDAPEFSRLVLRDVGVHETDVRFKAPAKWYIGYRDRRGYDVSLYHTLNPGPKVPVVLLCTDTRVYIVGWDSTEKKYRFLESMPYSNLDSIQMYDENRVLTLIDYQRTCYVFQIAQPGNMKIDLEKTQSLFSWLRSKLTTHVESVRLMRASLPTGNR